MGHLSHHKAYLDLRARLDRMPAGFPDTALAYEVLRLLFSPEEAALAARLPFRPTSVSGIARRLKGPVRRQLERMADRGLVLDLEDRHGRMRYCLAPPVVGFVEFSLMRKRSDLDQPALAAAFERFFDQSGQGFASTLFAGETQIGRALVHETALQPTDVAELLPYQRASEVVATARSWAVSLCYCRHLADHQGRGCGAPRENCLSLNGGADLVARHGHGRAISRGEALELLEQSREASLVFIADNVQRRVTYLCSCCGCCCEQLRAINRHGLAGAVKTSSFLARIDDERCHGCGRCVRRCPVQAIALTARAPTPATRKPPLRARIDEAICLGCGICRAACRHDALTMQQRPARVLTPEGTLERMLAMALERDRLHDLLFDEEGDLHELVLHHLAGAALRLPPVKRLLLGERLKSRFIGFLAARARRGGRAEKGGVDG